MNLVSFVIPAQAGIHPGLRFGTAGGWTPAFAEATMLGDRRG